MSLATPERIRTLQRKLYVKAKEEPEFRFYQLYDKVYREDILAHAYALARANAGAPGVDGQSFAAIEKQGLEEWLCALRKELHEKTYTPSPVRRVMIPKAGGGERPLGIPTVRDRVAQTAAKLILEPIFEADFEDCAYGYRPQRSAQDAVREVHQGLCEGSTDVVDADLSKYFDTIPHDQLMQSLSRRICDRQMLHLLKAWLQAPVEERDDKGNRRMTGGKSNRQGTPQGGVISPLLANLYMHRYLRHWRQQGRGRAYRARIVNYADDFVILSRGHAAEALAWTRRVMTAIGLTLNETKTCVRDATREPFHFLGYTFGPQRFRQDGRMYLAAWPSDKAVKRLKERISALLGPGNMEPWPQVVCTLNATLRGWAGYFAHGSYRTAYRAIDHYVVDRVRYFLRRRQKVKSQGRRRYSYANVFGPLGVQRMGALAVARASVGST